MTVQNLQPPLDRHTGSWRFLAAHHLCRRLPPLLAPRIGGYLFPFAEALRKQDSPWVTCVSGARARWPLSDIHGHHLALNGYHDWRLLAAAIAVTRRGDTIIEVGANIGTETIILSAITGPEGSVIALEPLPANTQILQQVLVDAGIVNVKLIAAAACETAGERFFVLPAKNMSGTGHLKPVMEEPDDVIRVEATTLDNVMLEHAAHPSLLVMDVEGAELAVLQGAGKILLHDRPCIILEACDRHAVRAGNSLQQLHEALSDRGYHVKKIGRYHLTEPDTGAGAEPCNWIAVPKEHLHFFQKVNRALLRCGFLPPLRHVNPLAGLN